MLKRRKELTGPQIPAEKKSPKKFTKQKVLEDSSGIDGVFKKDKQKS